MAEGSLIFISGGVRSGKSSFAEKVAADLAKQTGGNLHYIAAGKAYDSEMEARIQRHKEDRRKSGMSWITWEQPAGLAEISEFFGENDIILFDCLTTLLNNELFLAEDLWRKQDFQEKVSSGILQAIAEIHQRCKAIIVVSNEVLNELIGGNELVFTYGEMLGRLHQSIVEIANQAYLVEAGIPIQMKGEPA
ncbi:adenosylcobinamide kinase /adenosylcobinamide-phosphate guanylyltransferase [Cytobacillus oceanisediminis]|jgi:adenosylcobinamide kinase/adenosylcobinamide-phosphate guanylyltransferase|uniref:Adenosylcobinamide kinase n=1 Tax=Cytobacillus oceanisediminis TaxID=665099 RepID=A0A2V2ZPH7_9BACI|nr:bifunctional adenosylcobinamide kinase/adenosylcobinamide-phosphate guanylyltransferase [Cytobacillus oceanisediminis]PWW20060.1 adenosylcobinamide kinase /adenosylcobinamide-phosphate guanylyltransferase [Cytobacillus oceanisediminis]